MKNTFLRFGLLLFVSTIMLASCNKDDDSTPAPEVDACFSYSPDAVEIGDTVEFFNCSNQATSYSWDFGDGTTSEDEAPSHVYTDGGVYDVKLVVDNLGVKDSITKKVTVSKYSYVVNYGGYTGEKTTISLFDLVREEAVNGYFTSVNGLHMVSNTQSAYEYKGNVYFMGNNADQVFYVDSKTFKQTANGITDQIVKPRYCAGYGDILYVSCWGGDVWDDPTLSYIAKIDVNTHKVLGTIALDGGPEGLEVANGKLYAALNYDNKIAVIDLSSEAISYIETKAVTKDVIKTKDNNLFVTYVSTYSNFSANTGILYVNTISDAIIEYPLDGVSVADASVMALSNDETKLYVATGGHYVEVPAGSNNWEQAKGAVRVFNVLAGKFEDSPFVEQLTGLTGIAVNPDNDNVYCFISPSTTQTGSVYSYSVSGAKNKEVGVGIAPNMMFEIE